MEHKDFKFVFDTETSGLWPRQKEKAGLQEPQFQLTEIAIIVLDWGLQEVERYQTYIKPYEGYTTSWNLEAQNLTGISKEMCINKGLPLKEVIGNIKSLSEKYKNGRYVYPQLVAYNTPFDIDFMSIAYDIVFGNGYRQENGKSHLFKIFNPIAIDVLGMVRDKYGDNKEPLINFKLGTVAEYLGIQANGSLHGAMVDTEILVGIYRYLMSAQRGNSGVIQAVTQSRNKFQF